MTTLTRVSVDDGTYNRLMDELVSSAGGDVTAILAEIERLGLHRPGLGCGTSHA